MSGKQLQVFSAAIVFVGFGLAALKPPSNAVAQSSPAPKKAEEQFKNIKVLKGLPADQLFPTMQFVAASLGVECDFCHVRNAFEKDDKKPKEIARKMMEMMITINQENFDGNRKVTCYSCHRGNVRPVAIPAVMTEEEAKRPMGEPHGPAPETKEKEASKENSGPSPQQLLDKFIQASGGATAIDNITTRVMKGTIEFGDKSLPIDIYAKDPEQRISFTHMPEGDSVTAYNGHEGWLGNPGRPARDMQGGELDAAALDADLHLATHFSRMFSAMKVEGTEKIGDHETYVLVGERAAKTPIRLYFDQQSGLLVRLVRFAETGLGWLPTQIDYADYRDADGVKIPYQWTLARPSGRFTIQISELKQNVPVDDAKFFKPPPPPEQSKGPAK